MAYLESRPAAHPEPRSVRWWYPAALTALVLVGILLRGIGVGRYPGLIYDEYYYVPAALVLLGRKPPVAIKHLVPGIDPNLLSHPPLAKELIALSIMILGNHPWVWRLPGVVLGALAPIAAAGIAYQLFRHHGIALLAAGLASVDGLLLTMSRVALPDSTAVPLVLCALWALVSVSQYRESRESNPGWHWIGVGILLGLGLAAEWIGGQAILLAWAWLGFSSQKLRREYRRWIPATTVVPFLVYYASYFYAWGSGFQQSWLPKNPFVAFFKLQWLMLKDMWKLRFFHPWTASVWTWLGIPRPTALLLTTKSSETIRLMAFSDPILVWMGIAALIAGLVLQWRVPAQRRAWLFLAGWFLAFYGTWLLTPRSKFLYYFTTASVGLDIAVAAGFWLFWKAWADRRALRLVLGGTAAVGALSIFYLLPLWVGMAMPRPFYHALWWPPSWNPRVQSTKTRTQSFPLTYHPMRQALGDWRLRGFALSSSSPNVPSPWVEFRGNGTHNSVFSAGFTVSHGYSLYLGTKLVEAPTVSGDIAYVGTNSDALYAINLVSGQVQWSVGVPNEAMTAPLIDQGLVVIGIGNNGFRAYHKGQGWIRGQGSNGLLAFNAATGREVWFHATRGEDMATPAIRNGVVYEMTGDGGFIAVSLKTGQLLWQKRLGGFDSMSSLMIVGNQAYFASNVYDTSYPATRSTVWDINLSNHTVRWSRNLPVASGLSDCTLAINDGRIFIAGVPSISQHGQGSTVSNALYALNANNGRILWSHDLGHGKIRTLEEEEEGIPLAVNGTVYIGSPAFPELLAFRAANGQLLWKSKLPMPVTANPVLVGNRLVVAGMKGRIFAVSAKTGQIVGQDPTRFGLIGPASPLIVGHTLVQSTLQGRLAVQPLKP
ncbi:PQQ-binding-like beta-propeller repeat protein [Sulfobacillus harzensis]|uniref:PQQ-binding-like beta-propeller repeat protein n=1 Tax=Sulfobacillus harzensis TaxID=2729629 RepID=A0A7Y0L703_9FIRM|nr:PQQ-binding-like beta-propeller repeat protein [Sulfobacillus harzensis]NMP23595.1 PQQ-binding-like beta-propeller repeat protein [Sulfobacillus harzensis]